MRIRLWFGAAVMVAGGLLAACGDDVEKVDPEDWVDDLCGATQELSETEDDALTDYDDVFLSDSTDGEDVRDGAIEYVDAYDEALGEFVDEIEKLGQPDIEDGKAVLEALRDFVEAEKEVLDAIRGEIEDLEEEDEDLALAVDDLIFEIDYQDFLEAIEDADSSEADDIAELVEENDDCAEFLFNSA